MTTYPISCIIAQVNLGEKMDIYVPGNPDDFEQIVVEVAAAVRFVTGIIVGQWVQKKKWADVIEQLVGVELSGRQQFTVEDAYNISKKLGEKFIVWTKESPSLKYRDGVLFQ